MQLSAQPPIPALSSVQDPQVFSGALRNHLAGLEKRDWELWLLALGALALMTIGIVLVIMPGFLTEDRVIRLSATVTPGMVLAFVLFIGLLLAYLISKQLQLRAARFQSISETWNHEISRLHLLLDPLTRVYNRAALVEIIEKELSRARRHKSSITLLYADVDDFKAANTRYGHLFGDMVLAEVGGILKGATRGSDFVFRVGGDEFLVALIDTNEAGGHIVKDRVLKKVADWNGTSPQPGYRLGLSCGISECLPKDSLNEALARADQRMYAEKRSESASRHGWHGSVGQPVRQGG